MSKLQTSHPTAIPASVCISPQGGMLDPSAVSQSSWMRKCSELTGKARIAIIDDEEINIEVVQGYLEQEGYKNFIRTTDATQALGLIQREAPDVVLLDVMMPNVNGLEILSAMRNDERMSHTPVIVLTACTGPETKLQALQLGPSDFLAKPVDSSELLLRIRNVLAVKAYQDQLSGHSAELENMVAQRTRELVASRQRIIHCLARAAEFRDDDTGHHVTRVGKYVAIIANELGYDRCAEDLLEHAAKLHDIGKIGIPDSILLKKGRLNTAEFDQIKHHCDFGTSIIDPETNMDVERYQEADTKIGAITFETDGYPVMELAAIIARTHHEKWDGSGYPLGLKGESIPIEGRITAVADVYDALSSKRPYKPAFPREKCFEILEKGREEHFDPLVLDAFFARTEDIIEVQTLYAD